MRRRERDAFVLAALAALPLATYVLIRAGVSRLEAVGIAAFAVALVAGWRRGATQSDRDAAQAWRVGAWGEEATARALAALPRGARVFHDVVLPGRRENIDHVVVTRRGVAIIETKRWSGRVVVGRHHVRVNGERRDDVIDQVARVRRSLSRYLDGASVDAFVCVHGGAVRASWWRRRARIGDVGFGSPDAMLRWLRRRRRYVTPREMRRWIDRLEASTASPAGLAHDMRG